MNGIDKIIDKINDGAAREADDISGAARRTAEGLSAEWANRAETEANAIITRAQSDAENRLERQDAMSELEKKKLILASKRKIIAQAFDGALVSLRSMADEAYYAKLLLDIGLRAAATGTESVILSKTDRERYGAELVKALNDERAKNGLTAKLTLSDTTRELGGGLMLKNGDVEINGRLESVVNQLRETMQTKLAGVLFA